jgi:phosphatidylglycerophosphate synthase
MITDPFVAPEPAASSLAATALRRDALRCAGWCALALGLLGFGLDRWAGLSAWMPWKALAAFALATMLLLRWLPSTASTARFGWANRITQARLGLVLLLASGLGESPADLTVFAWCVVVLATCAAVLDAVDGPLARAEGLSSPFGARFDMETDAFLIMVLCALIVQFDKAGLWVLAAGLLRYAFVGAAWVWPWLAQPLPPSLRRKTVCVVQVASLIVCLGPVIPVTVSTLIAAASLLALGASFAVDVAWLARARHRP